MIAAPMISSPLPDQDSWIAYFVQADIPVLRHTVQQLAELRENADKSNARVISSVILHDPMMTLRMLAYIESKRSKSRLTDITTIERALMMIGMEPFFKDFQNLPLIEDHLKSQPMSMKSALPPCCTISLRSSCGVSRLSLPCGSSRGRRQTGHCAQSQFRPRSTTYRFMPSRRHSRKHGTCRAS
jgi:hypothetical protein